MGHLDSGSGNFTVKGLGSSKNVWTEDRAGEKRRDQGLGGLLGRLSAQGSGEKAALSPK